jgi:intracellular multiplication protein IcmQ
MAHIEQQLKVGLEVKKILDECIKTGPWQANLFLKGIKKKLEGLRDQFAAEMGLEYWQNIQPTQSLAKANNETMVYILLYQSQGNDMQKWQDVITSLVRYSVGRPIFKDEADAKAACQLNTRNPNNAYAVVKISADAIIPESVEQARFDRDGRRLIKLREGAIALHNIVYLVHISGQYRLVGNSLVKEPLSYHEAMNEYHRK